MPPPTPLAIATSSLARLLKEETSYHKELSQQEARLTKLQSPDASMPTDENAEFMIKQEVSKQCTLNFLKSVLIVRAGQKAAIDETKAVFPPLRERIEAALQKLEDKLEGEEDGEGAEVVKAREVVVQAKTVVAKKI